MAPLFFLFDLILLKFCTTLCSCNAQSSHYPNLPKFSAILIFGDSLLDTGNNNFISTDLQANHAPYGVSFPGGIPTGRFSDGKLMSDFLADALGLKQYVPPFLDPNVPQSELPTGVCFASAGSGYDDRTASMSRVISVTQQYQKYFKDYKHRIIAMLGEFKAANLLGKSLVFVTSGSNDVSINIYERPEPFHLFIDQYQDFLLGNVEKFIKSLYEDGCRNMAIAGLPPVCGPLEFGGVVGCLNNPNSDPQVYNRKLQAMLNQLQSSLPGSTLVYADIFTPLKELASNPIPHGLYTPIGNCCGEGVPAMGLTCNTFVLTCPNPSKYFLWDSIHPTQAVYRYMSDYLISNALPQFNLLA
ncbi:hypothetical protein ACET3Z_012505 [Daucus carota]